MTSASGVESCRPWRDFPCFDRADTSAAPELLSCATFFVFHASICTEASRYKRRSQQAGDWAFSLLIIFPIVHVEPEALSLGDRANSTCQARSSVRRRSVNGNKEMREYKFCWPFINCQYMVGVYFLEKTYCIPRSVCFVGLTWPDGRGGILFGVRGVSENCEI